MKKTILREPKYREINSLDIFLLKSKNVDLTEKMLISKLCRVIYKLVHFTQNMLRVNTHNYPNSLHCLPSAGNFFICEWNLMKLF